jgi:hypothetical protein
MAVEWVRMPKQDQLKVSGAIPQSTYTMHVSIVGYGANDEHRKPGVQTPSTHPTKENIPLRCRIIYAVVGYYTKTLFQIGFIGENTCHRLL